MKEMRSEDVEKLAKELNANNYCINNDNELAEAIQKLIEQNDELRGLLHIKINWGDN